MDISKKNVLLISSMLLTLIIVVSIVLIINKNDTNEIVSNPKREVNNNNFLTLMLEQSDGTYRESTSNTWPGDGYIFNKELSSCQNGGELDYDSENNKVILYNNKSDGCYVYFDLYNKPVINSINLGEVTNNSITISVSATNGTNEINNYYYIINDETPVSTTSNTYTFSGLSAGATYTIKVYVEDSEGYSSDTSSLSVETESIVYLADYIKNTVYQGDGINGLYYHDGQGSYTNADQEAGDNSYRYSGTNPNNYVCFGSDASTCPSDNLYRIIGVFGNEIKLIKSASLGNYYWSGSSSNTSHTWSGSTLNTGTLNGTYLNGLQYTWSNIIEITNWKVGGTYFSSSATAKQYYDAEVENDNSNTIYSAKIGLMYISDYGYAASPNYWTEALYYYDNIRDNNWMYSGSSEWTIFPNLAFSDSAFAVYFGSIDSRTVYRLHATRPVFYLNSNVQYASGSGTQSDPIRLVV